MLNRRRVLPCLFAGALLTGIPATLIAQPAGESRWVVDVGVGIDPSINGNVNSGAIGTLQGQATAILPQTYGNVYGTGTQLRFGGGYALADAVSLERLAAAIEADVLEDLRQRLELPQQPACRRLGLD